MSSWTRSSVSPRLAGRLRWIGIFLGFFLIFGAWSFAAPYDGPADEFQHAIRAVGVVSGQLAPDPAVIKDGQGNPGMGAYQQVPEGLNAHADCWGFTPKASAACATPISGGPLADVPTSAGRYNPLYYVMVGLPLKLSPNWTGLVLSRLISAALSAAMLACSFMVLRRWSRYGLMLAGMLTAATPMLAHLAGAVNPNGLEIAAGISLFSAGIPLLLGPPRGRRAPLLWLFGISVFLLANLRSFGPVWLLCGLAALLIPSRWDALRPGVPAILRRSRWGALRRSWSERLAGWLGNRAAIVLTIVFAVSLLASAAWILAMGTGKVVQIPDRADHFGISSASVAYFKNWGIYLEGMVGVGGWFDIWMPMPFYYAWVSAAAALMVFAMVVSGTADRLRFLVLIFGVVVVPGIAQVAEVNKVGFIIGGRYMLPLAVGIPLLGAFILERRLLNARQSHSLTKLFCIALLPAHLVLLVFAMIRWQQGINGKLNPLAGSWHPPSGSLIPVVLMVAGIVLTGVLFWRAPRDSAALPDLPVGADDARVAAVADAPSQRANESLTLIEAETGAPALASPARH
jgi:Predicted membrane protein (DUF2142)